MNRFFPKKISLIVIVTIDNRNAKYGDQRLFKEKILKKLETNHFSFFLIV